LDLQALFFDAELAEFGGQKFPESPPYLSAVSDVLTEHSCAVKFKRLVKKAAAAGKRSSNLEVPMPLNPGTQLSALPLGGWDLNQSGSRPPTA